MLARNGVVALDTKRWRVLGDALEGDSIHGQRGGGVEGAEGSTS